MTFGPAMSGGIFDEPGSHDEPVAAPAELLAIQRVIVDELDAILGELRSTRG